MDVSRLGCFLLVDFGSYDLGFNEEYKEYGQEDCGGEQGGERDHFSGLWGWG